MSNRSEKAQHDLPIRTEEGNLAGLQILVHTIRWAEKERGRPPRAATKISRMFGKIDRHMAFAPVMSPAGITIERRGSAL